MSTRIGSVSGAGRGKRDGVGAQAAFKSAKRGDLVAKPARRLRMPGRSCFPGEPPSADRRLRDPRGLCYEG